MARRLLRSTSHVALALLLATACSLGAGGPTASPGLPPTGVIWFGDSYEPDTYRVFGRRNSADRNAKIAVVARFTRDLGPTPSLEVVEGLVTATHQLTVDQNANAWAAMLSPDELGFETTIGYLRIRDSDGISVATSETLTIH